MATRIPSQRSQSRARASAARSAALAALPDDTRGLLSDLTETQQASWAAEARILALVCAWVDANPCVDRDVPVAAGSHGDQELALAGEGCPPVSDFAVVEVAAHLGMTPDAGSRLVADALELRHRLPRLWTRVQDLQLPAWRARRIAHETIDLTPAAAAYVDEQVSAIAHTVGLPTIDKLVTRAKAAFMPERAAEEARQAADRRHVGIDLRQVGHDGTCRIAG